ncbi:MAG TPA: 2,3-bisphosphoglycerate-independent phosphoglycerate mutase [Thermoanaerobaculia bacterium]|nr:2,3-bisphosphoglycerate-independent phosphoglycerate mutase [Thermoanaerobaculia bacterium]
MDPRLALLSSLAQESDRKLVLLVLDGVGDLRSEAQPETALDRASLPNLDALAARGALGRTVPVGAGITPGSGPGHLALFGYDPLRPEVDIGRGVLEALGSGLTVRKGDVAVRGNFATADGQGRLTDRRAGRIPTEECRRLVALLNDAVARSPVPGLGVEIQAGEGHRFVMLLSGENLSPEVEDTDPQMLGVPPLEPSASKPEAASTVARLAALMPLLEAAIAAEPKANRLLLRGFSVLPHLPSLADLFGMRFGAFAGYPLYRGVAGACGMEVVPCGKRIGDLLDAVEAHWSRFDFFFLHVKQTDQAGEDGDLAAKVAVLEEVDRALPRLLALGPGVVAVTGDHSTPAPMKSHSWHPVPVLLWSDVCYRDDTRELSEEAAIHGHLGTFPARDLLALMLANAGRLKKFGA